MPELTTSYAQVILDANSIPIGLAFPILIGKVTITGPETWRQFLKSYELLEAAVERNGNGESEPDPEYGCRCSLPGQTCGGCREINADYRQWEQTEELPF